VLTGGSSKLPGAVDLAKEILGLPAQNGFPEPLGGLVDKVDDPSFSTAVGLVLWGWDSRELDKKSVFGQGKMMSNISGGMGGTVSNLRKWVGKFLP
jgi:cell division protein FtsA